MTGELPTSAERAADPASPGTGSGRRRILVGHLGSFGDCLLATPVARQIKADFPQAHVTWGIGSCYSAILEGNPYIDEVWRFPVSSRQGLPAAWRKFEPEALARQRAGEFDEVYFTQLFPSNLDRFDGNLRSSIFSGYGRPVTVPIQPVLRLHPGEVGRVERFACHHRLRDRRQVVLFECSPQSDQSFVNPEFAMDVARRIVTRVPDAVVLLSTTSPISCSHPSIISASELTFRENAELTKYCTLLIGCSSGITWLSTSDGAKQLPMMQLLRHERNSHTFNSVTFDFERWRLPTDQVLDLFDCDAESAARCAASAMVEGFAAARRSYHMISQPHGLCSWDYVLHLMAQGRMSGAARLFSRSALRFGASTEFWTFPFRRAAMAVTRHASLFRRGARANLAATRVDGG